MMRKNSSAVREVFSSLLSQWGREKPLMILTWFGITSAIISDLLMPVYSGKLIDAIAKPGTDRQVALNAALHVFSYMAMLSVILVVGRKITQWAIVRVTSRLMCHAMAEIFGRIQRFSTEWHINNLGGSTVRSITRGVWAIDSLNNILLVSLWPALLVLFGSSFLLGFRWPLMGIFVGSAAILYIVISVALSLNYVAPAARLANKQDARISGAISDAITCNSVVKAFGAESREDERVRKVVAKWADRALRSWTRSSNSSTIQLCILFALRVLVVLYTLLLWWLHKATPGDIAFVLTTAFVVHGYLREVGQQVAGLQRSVNEMEQYVSFTHLPIGTADKENAHPITVRRGEIRVERATFRYEASPRAIFDDLSVDIRPGQRVGLIGHSGAGKSTFIKLLHRLYDLEKGGIYIDGQNIADVTQISLRSAMALVAQEPLLFHRSLAENIAYGRPSASRKEIEEAARLANAHSFIVRQPKEYQTLVGERGVKLSGGERQRIALARAFLANAPILILDEATSSLDSESEALIQEAMDRLMLGRTSVIIAHRLSTVRALDRILVFDHGRVIEDGTHDALMIRPDGAYRKMVELQAYGLRTPTKRNKQSLHSQRGARPQVIYGE